MADPKESGPSQNLQSRIDEAEKTCGRSLCSCLANDFALDVLELFRTGSIRRDGVNCTVISRRETQILDGMLSRFGVANAKHISPGDLDGLSSSERLLYDRLKTQEFPTIIQSLGPPSN